MNKYMYMYITLISLFAVGCNQNGPSAPSTDGTMQTQVQTCGIDIAKASTLEEVLRDSYRLRSCGQAEDVIAMLPMSR